MNEQTNDQETAKSLLDQNNVQHIMANAEQFHTSF